MEPPFSEVGVNSRGISRHFDPAWMFSNGKGVVKARRSVVHVHREQDVKKGPDHYDGGWLDAEDLAMSDYEDAEDDEYDE